MLISKNQIDQVLKYKFNDIPVTSLYLNVDPSMNTKEEFIKNWKTLLRENREKLKKEDFSREGYYSVLMDFDRITHSVESIKGHGFNSIAIFSSSKNNFIQTYELDEPVRDRLIVEFFPYTKPLFTVLRLKKRYIALLFKKDKLRAFEVYGDKINEDLDLFNTSHFSSRANDYIFINEKKYQNRMETEYHKFLREASGAVLDLFMEKGADCIVLGGEKNICRDFVKHMHSYLHERYAGCIDAKLNAKDSEVLKEVRKINEKIISEKDKKLTERIRSELSKDGEACKGIQNILEALSMAAVRTLVVEDGYMVPGFVDMETGFLYIEKDKAASDNASFMPVKDIINEAVDEAIHQGAEVRIVKNKELLRGLDHVAALLRFNMSS
jgi:peptide chain release factor subunit 1